MSAADLKFIMHWGIQTPNTCIKRRHEHISWYVLWHPWLTEHVMLQWTYACLLLDIDLSPNQI